MNRLRFDLKTRSPVVERPDKEICGVCRRQTSKYTCPSCNLHYCSLACFKSEAHSECSESFYRKEIETEIQHAPTKSAHERHRMMELLRNFEAEESTREPQDTSSDDDQQELESKLGAINLDDADPDALWKLLSPAQRDVFSKAMRDPTSELAQQLLSSPELAAERKKPWWESPLLTSDDDPKDSAEYGALPRMLTVPEGLKTSIKNSGPSRPLVYNIIALCLVYAYITRRLAVSPLSSLATDDPDRSVALDLLSQLAPFLVDRRSKVLFPSVDHLITDVWSRLEALADPPSREFLALLLVDVGKLIQPQLVSVIKDDEPQLHHSRLALLAISDIAAFFASLPNVAHVVHKLNFYIAFMGSQNADFLRQIVDEVRLSASDMRTGHSA